MELKMKPKDAQEYQALYVAGWDLGAVRAYVRYILKKGWHGWPVFRRGSVRFQQQAFTEALVVAYGRLWSPPVLKGFAWPGEEDAKLHAHLKHLRDKVVGHSAPPSYSVRPWVQEDYITHIFGQPHPHFTPEELSRLEAMLLYLGERVQSRRLEILTSYLGADEARQVLL